MPVVVIKDQKPNPHFLLMGGESAVCRVVARFYDRMDGDPGLRVLRNLHAPDLGESRQKLFDYLCGWLGGPEYYEKKHGPPRLRMRHEHIAIDDVVRDQWMACMIAALAPEPLSPEFRREILAAFHKLATFLRNVPSSHHALSQSQAPQPVQPAHPR